MNFDIAFEARVPLGTSRTYYTLKRGKGFSLCIAKLEVNISVNKAGSLR